jgi:hypothetical protein
MDLMGLCLWIGDEGFDRETIQERANCLVLLMQ